MSRMYAVILSIACLVGVSTMIVLAQDNHQASSDKSKTPSGSSSASTKQVQADRAPLLERTKTNQSPEAIKRANVIRQQVSVLLDQAHAMLAKGNFSGAEQACLKAIALYENAYSGHAATERVFLGKIYLQEGQNEKALECFHSVAVDHYASMPPLELDIALAYCRMGKFQQAKRFYSDDFVLQYSFGGKKANIDNLPGTDDPESLQASVLLARGVTAYFCADPAEAIENLQQADKLKQKNALTHYYWAAALRDMDRPAVRDALPSRATRIKSQKIFTAQA